MKYVFIEKHVVLAAFTRSKQRYGAPRLTDELRAQGYPFNVKTVALTIKRLRGQRPGFTNPDAGVPHSRKQHMVTLIRHIEEKGTHFRGQQVGRCGPRGSGHSSQGERCCKINARRNG